MPDAVTQATLQSAPVPGLRPWTTPRLAELPKLTALTLASAIGGGGGTGGGGSTVFSFLMAATIATAALTGCIHPGELAPTEPRTPVLTMQPVTCRVDLTRQTMECARPAAVAGKEVLGKQGIDVRLASSNVQSAGGIFSADVSVKNLSDVDLGASEAGDTTGLFVFFVSGPTVTGGSGALTVTNPDTAALFTASGQLAFHYDTILGPREISTPRTWEWSYDPGVVDFTFTVLVAADVPQVGLPLHWGSVSGNFTAGGAQSYLGAVNSATSALIFYYDNSYLHRNVSGWDRFPVPLGITPEDVAAAGDDRFYVRANQTLYLVEGRTWTEFNPRGLEVWNFGAAPDGTLALFAYDPVGNNTILTAYDGTTWHDIPTAGTTGTVVVGDRSNAIAVAYPGQTYIWHGGSWAQQVAGDLVPGTPIRMWGVQFGVNASYLATWGYLDPNLIAWVSAATYRFDPCWCDQFYGPDNPVHEGTVIGIGAGNYFLATASNTEIRDMSSGALLDSTGTSFSWMAGPTWNADYSQESWLVGLPDGRSATYRYVGPLESIEGSFDLGLLGKSVVSGAVLGGKFYGVTQSTGPGGDGDVIIADGATASLQTVSTHRIYGIHPRTPTDIVVAGEDGLITYNGTSWTLLDSLVYGAHFRAIWAHGDTTFAWRDTTLMRRIGAGTWGVASSQGWTLSNTLGGSSGYDVYLGSAEYALLRFTGDLMYSLILPSTPDPDVQHVTAVSSRDPNDVWVGLGGSPNGANVRLAHWDGTGWTWWLQSELPLTGIGGIVTQEHDRALIGDAQGIFLFDAGTHSFRRVTPASAGIDAGRGLMKGANGSYWALGSDGTISHGTR
jgi:hypothetical protein